MLGQYGQIMKVLAWYIDLTGIENKMSIKDPCFSVIKRKWYLTNNGCHLDFLPKSWRVVYTTKVVVVVVDQNTLPQVYLFLFIIYLFIYNVFIIYTSHVQILVVVDQGWWWSQSFKLHSIIGLIFGSNKEFGWLWLFLSLDRNVQTLIASSILSPNPQSLQWCYMKMYNQSAITRVVDYAK